ncbi:ABC transporter ATP-binding protein [Aquabacterium sp.]|uniref:ABC transporter ATP-binding protein n=1 Tax=Aquabacterium sp. TaxID=1872578 RepID=UPI0025BB191D|nr:ABC transporter ATP-binding protein [Aquabacterium sp.]
MNAHTLVGPAEAGAVTDTAQDLLSVENLSVAYGKIEAVRGLNLRVRPGEIVTVIGPNGAGKSTLLGALMGVLPTTSGQIRVDGRLQGQAQVDQRVAQGVALVPESRALFASMSVEDNLRLGGYRLRGESAAQHKVMLDEVFSLFPRLKERRKQEAATLSGGERQMLALGRALMGRPRLLMLDEPSLGLAPLVVRDIFAIIVQLRAKGVSILLVEQNARAALRVADQAYVLELGRVVMSGPAAQLADDPRIVQAYLGLHGSHQDKLA